MNEQELLKLELAHQNIYCLLMLSFVDPQTYSIYRERLFAELEEVQKIIHLKTASNLAVVKNNQNIYQQKEVIFYDTTECRN